MDRNAANFEHHLGAGVAGDTCITVGHLRTFVPCSSNLDPYLSKLIQERRLERGEAQLIHDELSLLPIYGAGGAGTDVGAVGGAIDEGGEDSTLKTAAEEAMQAARLLLRDPTVLARMQVSLSRLSVEDVCTLIDQLDMIPAHRTAYKQLIIEANISGLVLSVCDVDELKHEMRMPLGDWTLFKMLVEFMRNGNHMGLGFRDETALIGQQTAAPVTQQSQLGTIVEGNVLWAFVHCF